MAQNDIIGAIVAIFFIIIMAPVFLQMISVLNENQCQEYIQKIDQKNAEIRELEDRIDELEAKNENISKQYEKLVKQNITKKDIEKIESDLNQTDTKIRILNKKFETVNNNFVSVYNQLYFNLKIAITLSIFSVSFLFLEFMSSYFYDKSIIRKILGKSEED